MSRLGIRFTYLLLVVVGLLGCSRDEAPVAPAAAESVSAPVEPPQLLADVVVTAPGEAWKQARGWFGDEAALLPANWGMLVATALALPAMTAANIDETVPLVGAVLEPDSRGPRGVLAIHLRSGRELVASLTKGAAAPFAASKPAEGMTILTPRERSGAGPALGVLGDYLLMARDGTDLRGGGPYVVHRLGARRAEREPSLVVEARTGRFGRVLRDVARDVWSEQRRLLAEADDRGRASRGGRAPDFGDPAAVLQSIDDAMEEVAGLLETVSSSRVLVRPRIGGVTMSADLHWAPESQAAARLRALSVGGVRPLLELPSQTMAAMLAYTSDVSGAAAERLANVVGARLTPRERARLDDAADAWSQGVGEPVALGILEVDDSRAFFVQAPLSDTEQFSTAVDASLRLVTVPAFRDPLAALVGRPHVAPPSKLDTNAWQAAIRFSDPKKSTPRDSDARVDIVWSVARDRARIALATVGARRAEALLADPGATLDAEPTLRSLAEDHVDDAFFAAAARLHAPDRNAQGWIAVAAGCRKQTVWFDIRADEPALVSMLGLAMAK